MPEASGHPSVVLIDNNPDLRELEDLILSDAGFQVQSPPAGTSPVTFAVQRRPQVIVIHLLPQAGTGLELIDQLQANPTTRVLPVVAIASAEHLAARAQAGANVTVALVAPYDVT